MPKTLGPNGETTVMFAARNGNPEAIKALVAAGADVNAAEKMRGTTALMWAATERHPGAVKALIELGADYSAKSGPAGLPRNRTVGPINGNAVALAGQRRRAAAAAGRTIEEQIQFEQFSGTFVGAGAGFGAGQPDGDAPAAAAARGRGAAAGRGTPGAAGRGAAGWTWRGSRAGRQRPRPMPARTRPTTSWPVSSVAAAAA